MDKIKVYMSHPIRGKGGSKTTYEEMKANNQKAIVKGKDIQSCFPELDVYIPAEHDEFVIIAYQKDYITIDQLLDVDCEIVKKCKLLLVYNWENCLGGGMKREVECAKEHNIPVIEFSELDVNVIDKIVKLFNLEE